MWLCKEWDTFGIPTEMHLFCCYANSASLCRVTLAVTVDKVRCNAAFSKRAEKKHVWRCSGPWCRGASASLSHRWALRTCCSHWRRTTPHTDDHYHSPFSTFIHFSFILAQVWGHFFFLEFQHDIVLKYRRSLFDGNKKMFLTAEKAAVSEVHLFVSVTSLNIFNIETTPS